MRWLDAWTGDPSTLPPHRRVDGFAVHAFNRRPHIPHNQYTTTYKPSHTTSTKCQYHAAPSNPK